jgi:hypothetical protein
MRHRLLNGCADAVQIVRQMVGVHGSLHRHHAAANVHIDRSRNDRAARGGTTLPTVAPMPQCASGIAATHL